MILVVPSIVMEQIKDKVEEKKDVVEGQVVEEETIPPASAIIESTYFAGPLPHPYILKKYEEILPGCADRIIKMAEDQSKHRMGLEKEVVGSNIMNEKIGMFVGFVMSIIVIATSTYLVSVNKSIEGFIGYGSMMVLYTYNYASQKRKEETTTDSSKESDSINTNTK
ncbi:MAG: DUF2335 domain-containing protein [Candidatus Roizmanbacteria bacterium]